MGKSRDLSEFERGMIVGARNAGCSISETVKRLGFSKTAVSRVYREWCEKQKTSSHRGSCGRKRLVDENGEKRIVRMVEANNQATTVQIQTLYNSSGQEKPISLTTTRRTLKRLGYDRRVQQRDSLVLAGLEALAVYTSCPEKLDTSTDFVGGKEEHPDPKIRSSIDAVCNTVCSTKNHTNTDIQTSVHAVCSTENHHDTEMQTSVHAVCSTDHLPDPKMQTSIDAVNSTKNDLDPKMQSSRDGVCSTEKCPDPKIQTSMDAEDIPNTQMQSSLDAVNSRDHKVQASLDNDCNGENYLEPWGS